MFYIYYPNSRRAFKISLKIRITGSNGLRELDESTNELAEVVSELTL